MEQLTKAEEAVMNKYYKMKLAISILKLCNSIMVNLVTITLLVAPIILAIKAESAQLLTLLLIYPSIMFLRSAARYRKKAQLFFWILIYLDFALIQWLANGPTWFIWPTLGLLSGYHILFYTIPNAELSLLRLSECAEWISIEEKVKADKLNQG